MSILSKPLHLLDPKEIEQLQRELASEKTRREEEERKARYAKRAEFNAMAVPLLVQLPMAHDRTSCSDAKAVNSGRCTRCTLLDMAGRLKYDNLGDMEITISVHRAE